ncbi:MAG: hypothetical protein ACTHLO_04825 [Pseudolabrys sp.]
MQSLRAATSSLWSKIAGDTSTPAIDRLVPFPWTTELAIVCTGMLASFLLAGFWYPYWRIADMDFWIVYNGFLLNAGLPQEYFDHPGYLSILLLTGWLRGLHALGLVPVDALTQLPRVSDAAAFEAAWTAATRAGRVLSLVIAMGFVVSFGALMRRWLRDWRIAGLALFFLAFSGGMAMEMRILRTELTACALFYCALVILLIAAEGGSRALRPLLVGCAALMITLALENKVQIVFLIAALPVLLIPFGPRAGGTRFWTSSPASIAALGASAAAALLSLYLAKDIAAFGLATLSTATLRLPQLTIGATLYWPLMALWLGIGVAAYAIWWRAPLLETLATVCAIVAGTGVGLLALDIVWHPNDAIVVFHPIEQLYSFGAGTAPELATGAFSAKLKYLVEALGGLIARRTFVLQSSSRPTIFLEWFVIAATIYAIRRREWPTVLKVCVLMATVWGVDLLGMARGLKQEYFLITDPLVIIAGALLLARLPALQTHRLAWPVGAALIVVHVAISQAEPVKHVFRHDSEEVLCGMYHNAKRVERLPVCATLPKP